MAFIPIYIVLAIPIAVYLHKAKKMGAWRSMGIGFVAIWLIVNLGILILGGTMTLLTSGN